MFDLKNVKHLVNFHNENYKAIQDDLSKILKRRNTRMLDYGTVEELYRFGDTDFYLEVFYPVPSALQIKQKANMKEEQVQFGIFNWDTNEPITLQEAFYKLPKEYRNLICFNVDHFSEMEDVFDIPQNF